MRKTYTTALILGLALALQITFSPILAHPYWEGDDGEQVIPQWMGDYENMPHWGDNETYPMPHWYNNGTTTTTTNAVSTITIPTTTNATSGNITLTGGSNCTGFTANAYSGMGNTTTGYVTFGEEGSGSSIKEQIKEKLAKLASVA
jgi:hypothetical protein